MYGEEDYPISRRQFLKLVEPQDAVLDGGLLHVVQDAAPERKPKKASVNRSSQRGSRSGGHAQRVRRAISRLKMK
jgi:hypothetical protein